MRRKEIGKEKWGRWKAERADKESYKHSARRLKPGMYRELEGL